MNFIAICLHSLDMRDFHSHLRTTPFLDQMRAKSIFIPMGRGQGHHRKDSLNAEITGVWTARYANARLTKDGYVHCQDKSSGLPKTVIEYLQDDGYDIFTCIGFDDKNQLGTMAAANNERCSMNSFWLADQPNRLAQFNCPKKMSMSEWLTRIKDSKKFYAHIFLRATHRPWDQGKELLTLAGKRQLIFIDSAKKMANKAIRYIYAARKLANKSVNKSENSAQKPPKYIARNLTKSFISAARKLALEKPSEFAFLRRRGLERADQIISEIFEATKHIKDVTYIIYSNHGEVYDHFRYHLPHPIRRSKKFNLDFVVGTSHASFPYEVLYANMQMWLIPGHEPRAMRGCGRSIDITPTILELAGVTPEAMDGESMLSYFSDGVFPDRDRYAEIPLKGGCISMVRKDGCKLISVEHDADALPGHRLAVFDLKSDPYEYVNVINTPQGQEVLDWAIQIHKSLREHPPPPT